jgi:hypothetical protein
MLTKGATAMKQARVRHYQRGTYKGGFYSHGSHVLQRIVCGMTHDGYTLTDIIRWPSDGPYTRVLCFTRDGAYTNTYVNFLGSY